MPLVTVLLPVYNAERHLAESVQSILDQTFSDFELLIVDDGSTDKSAEIIHLFTDKRIRYIKNEQNLKLIKTLNRGLQEARGEFIARMDSDDISFPQRLERQLQFFQRRPDVDVAGTFAIRIDDKGLHGALIKRPVGDELQKTVWWPTPLLHPTVMMRRQVVDRGFTYDESCLHCEDYDLWIRLSKAGLKIENLPAPMLYYRVHGGGVSIQNRQLQLRNSFQVFSKHFKVSLSEMEYYCLIGASPHGLSWSRRLDIVRQLSAGLPLNAQNLFHQLVLHFRHTVLGRAE